MTTFKALNALPALKELRKFRLPFAKAAGVFRVCKALDSVREFYAEEERKLLDRYAQKDENGNPRLTEKGQVLFDSYTDRDAYCSAVSELCEADCGVEITPVTLTEADFGDQLIIPAMLDELDGIVEIG